MPKSEATKQIIALQRKGDLESARLQYEATKDSLQPLETQEILGNFAFYERRFQAAISHYETAIRTSETYLIAPYQYLVGFNHAKAGQLVDAFKRYAASIDIDPTFVEAYIELGVLLMQVRDYSGAARCFEDAVRIDPNDLGNYHNLVQALAQLAKAEPGTHTAKLERAQAEYDLARSRLLMPGDEFRSQIDA